MMIDRTAWAVVASLSCAAAAQTPDKSPYHLFNPTPPQLMRPLSADRPDGTESPRTVDAGHVQVEMSVAEYRRNRRGEDTHGWTLGETNLKFGLLNHVDLQLVLPLYQRDTAAGDVAEGTGDLQVRTKINIWGNDPGQGDDGPFNTAFGVMPFIQLPIGDDDVSSRHVEGGFMFMLGWDAAENWGLGFMAEIDAVYDDADDDYDVEFFHTAVLGFDVAGALGAYVEYIGIVSSDGDTAYQAVFSTGLTYEVHRNLVLDAGTRVGMTRAAEDLALFTGFTWRY